MDNILDAILQYFSKVSSIFLLLWASPLQPDLYLLISLQIWLNWVFCLFVQQAWLLIDLLPHKNKQTIPQYFSKVSSIFLLLWVSPLEPDLYLLIGLQMWLNLLSSVNILISFRGITKKGNVIGKHCTTYFCVTLSPLLTKTYDL